MEKDIQSPAVEQLELEQTDMQQEHARILALHERVGGSPEEMLPKMNTDQFLSSVHRLYLLTGHQNVSEGKEISIDFRGNKELELQVTAGHLLPPEVRQITIDGLRGERSGLQGEFYAENGERLLIFTDTTITIDEVADEAAIAKMQAEVEENLVVLNIPEDQEADIAIARAALERGIEPSFALKAQQELVDGYEGMDEAQRAEMISTVVGRARGKFQLQFPDTTIDENSGRYSPEFLAYLLMIHGVEKYDEITGSLGYSEEEQSRGHYFYREEVASIQSGITANISREPLPDVPADLSRATYMPGSVEARMLFRQAAREYDLPEDWANSTALHEILNRESAGIVGLPNYTFSEAYEPGNQNYVRRHPEVWADIHNAIKNHEGRSGEVVINDTPVVSSATGLGQLLQANVDRYYPGGRNGIGNPIAEAVGMMRYIKDRYGTPEIALANYGVNHEGY